MKIHYLNCATMYPRFTSLFIPWLDRVPAICMLMENEDRLILVDTGCGTADMEDTKRLGITDRLYLRTRSDPEQPAVKQIERMGFKPGDVQDIICTHLDRDHAGGLPDFPDARVHVHRIEYDAAMKRKALPEKERYRKCHFAHGPNWVLHEELSGEKWFGMDCIRNLAGLPSEIVLVPLYGHTKGMVGVAVDTEDGWIMHCADAFYIKEELRQDGKLPFGFWVYQQSAHMDRAQSKRHLDMLKRLMREHGDEVQVLASHDQFEYRALFRKPLE